VQCVRIGASIG